MKKYEFTGETIEKFGVTLQRIRALKDVKQGNNVIAIKGETGGWIAEEKNLSQDGYAWVSGNARVYGDAWVSGNARVSGNAWVYGDARVSGNAQIIKPTDILTVGPHRQPRRNYDIFPRQIWRNFRCLRLLSRHAVRIRGKSNGHTRR